MKLGISLLLFLMVFASFHDTSEGKVRFSSRSSGRSSSSSRGRSSGGYSSSSRGSSSSNHVSSSSGHSSVPHVQTTSVSRGSTSSGFGSSGGSHTPLQSGRPPAGSSSNQQNKNVNTDFLHGEGGGATRPAQAKPPISHAYPPFPSMSPPQVPHTGGTLDPHGRPGFTTDSRQTSPYAPSAPPLSSLPSQQGAHPGSRAPSHTSHAWANPHVGANRTGISQPSQIGWKDDVYRPSTTNTMNTPLQAPHLPYRDPYAPPQASYTPHQNLNGHIPPNQFPPGLFGTHGASAPPHTFGSSYPSSHPYPPPMGNPYSTHPGGNPFSSPGQMYPHGQVYPQQPQILAQPGVQPYIPGQTVIMMPGQQDSGRGLGQIFKEALVFSTVNAGVNRLINPHTHYVPESRPDSGSAGAAGTTTHITYNNQYFNTYPGSNGTVDMTGAPQGAVPGASPGGFPIGSNNPIAPVAAGGFPAPGYVNNVNTPGVIPAISPGIPNAGGVVGGPSSIGTSTSSTSNSTGTPGSNSTVSNDLQYRISDEQLAKITEELFAQNALDVSKYIKLNLQKRATSDNITDEAKEPLIYVEPQLLEYPSIYATRNLYDNYEHDSRVKENRTSEKRMEENLLLDTYLNTNIMVITMRWLSGHGFIDPDDFERKDILRHIWFNQFDGATSGFERVFTSETYANTSIIGVQDWLYFEYLESQKRLNYMSYTEKLDLGAAASLVKLNFQMDGISRPNATIFVGTLPELEMSLYTICFYTRPNNLCPVSLGGTKFNIFTHTFRYFGNDLIDLALPMI